MLGSVAGDCSRRRRQRGYLTPNDDYETALVVIDDLDKGTSKRQLARRARVSRMTVVRIDEHRERYLSER